MATLITLNVTNMNKMDKDIFIFQEPSLYEGGETPFVNSIYTDKLYNDQTLTFRIYVQYYGGVQENKSEPKINEPSGERSAIKIVELTPNNNEEVNNSINMVMDDEENWYLENAIYDPETQAGAFRISTPTYGSFDKVFYAGSAVRASSGEVIMSNFIEASPNSNMDFQPQLKFYVQVGSYEAGNVMDFTTSSKMQDFVMHLREIIHSMLSIQTKVNGK
ncbi:hypothetical protein [Pantoea sp. CCBC3-3-1]|uniref:hypothetical protein n=1 Tax=Pantoea sp. CCBC3-3-1 TaxID=2490851 RepID=UPI0011BD8855|nr:hypothetical protein [Pantoea sp. CCBC3-3-1]